MNKKRLWTILTAGSVLSDYISRDSGVLLSNEAADAAGN